MNITLGTIILFVVAAIIIRFAARFLFKILGWLLLLGGVAFLLYHFGVGPFAHNPIAVSTWEEMYCENPKEQVKCNCIVNPIKNDLEGRFTADELRELEQNRMELTYAMQQSFKKVKPQIMSCLAKEDAEGELTEFMKDLIPIDNDILQSLHDLKDEFSEGAQEKFDELTEGKDAIDKKYE